MFWIDLFLLQLGISAEVQKQRKVFHKAFFQRDSKHLGSSVLSLGDKRSPRVIYFFFFSLTTCKKLIVYV